MQHGHHFNKENQNRLFVKIFRKSQTYIIGQNNYLGGFFEDDRQPTGGFLFWEFDMHVCYRAINWFPDDCQMAAVTIPEEALVFPEANYFRTNKIIVLDIYPVATHPLFLSQINLKKI